ncbi:HPr family phosphocarrier protein [Vallitalea okinawensis]|uniref:HPr family phosphocarrier protein n=1 Tax=Vallitalea okinawensis TaxID=2078660 RepID=UPI000CFB9914|nr:HPr family phosphocarrier protein [Vallitalea okinawensis]
MKTDKAVLVNEEGLHARPANVFTQIAKNFSSDITVLKNSDETKKYNPKSILSIMSMAAMKGDELTIVAEGEDEDQAVVGLIDCVKRGFTK